MQAIYPSFPKKCVLPKCIPNSLKSKWDFIYSQIKQTV
jgi:hypothetical protein